MQKNFKGKIVKGDFLKIYSTFIPWKFQEPELNKGSTKCEGTISFSIKIYTAKQAQAFLILLSSAYILNCSEETQNL
jgi:hypothetical protein